MPRRFDPTEEQFERLVTAYERFAPFDQQMIDAFKQVHSGVRIAKGERWLSVGERCEHVAFVVSGLLHMFYEVDGKVTSIEFSFENGITADYDSFLRQAPARVNIEALEDAELLVMSFQGMQWLYENVSGSDRIGRRVAEFLFMAVSAKNDSFILDTPEQRYLTLLTTRPKLMQRVPLYLIASYLGVTPEALSRIRRRLAQQGVSTS